MKMRHLLLPMILTSTMASYSFANSPAFMNAAINVPTSQKAGPIATSAEMSDKTVNEKFSDIIDMIQSEQMVQNQKGSHKVTLKRFSAESASFFVAIAAVQLESLMMNFSDNPRAMQDHLESIKDPIGHLSFYMFMQANGYATNFLTNRLAPNMDPLAKTQALRSITYKGMAAGSIVSSLTAEVATAVRDCSKMIFEKEKEAKAEKAKVCNAAFDQWKRSTKAQQYVSQIISLFVSQDTAQFIEMRGKQAIAWTSNEALSLAVKSTATRKGLQVAALQVAMVIAPGGLVVKGIKIVGKIGQFAGFTFIDHLLAPFIHKAVANVWQPAQFDFDVMNFNTNVFDAKRDLWRNDRSNEKLSGNIAEMTTTMAEWRQSQLTQFQTSHGIWVDSLLKVIGQTNGTFGFYKTYVENLFSTENVTSDIRAGKLPLAAMNNENGYPQRTLPLFGVTLKEAMPDDYESPRDLPLNKPSDLESEQIKTVRDVNVEIKRLLAVKGIYEHDAELLSQIATAFDSADKKEIGLAIAKINDVVLYNKLFVTDSLLKQRLLDVRNKLGNPYPILTPGMAFSYAYETHSFNAEAMRTFDHSKGPGNWLPRTSDYLLLQMVCGGETNLYDSNWDGFAPYFVSPKITKNSVRANILCASLNLQNLYSMKITATDGKTYTGITDYINHNLREDVLGDITDRKSRVFGDWWTKNVNAKLGEMYEKYDKEYINVIASMTQNWHGYGFARKCLNANDGKGISGCVGKIANAAVDKLNGSDYLDKNALLNLKYELDIYTSVLNELLQDTSQSSEVLSNAVQRNLVGALMPLKAPGVMQNYVPKESTNELAAKKALEARSVLLSKSVKDPGGFLRRLKAGDRSIVASDRMNEMPEIKNLRSAIEARLSILAQVEVKDGVILNFPDKAASNKALDDLSNSMTAFQKKCASLISDNEKPQQVAAENTKMAALPKVTLSASQKAIFDASSAGIQSVIGEISSLNMALYTSKYKLADSYEDLIMGLKSTKGEKPMNTRQGSNPFGGK
ncbi:MAG: hypothetical protein H7326_10720 [Bdellovibrionaceae bacterium]|nr:hypothetical protein [Pseudobdellovibrionaceae bacterium]